jgi:hypothetical protein
MKSTLVCRPFGAWEAFHDCELLMTRREDGSWCARIRTSGEENPIEEVRLPAPPCTPTLLGRLKNSVRRLMQAARPAPDLATPDAVNRTTR